MTLIPQRIARATPPFLEGDDVPVPHGGEAIYVKDDEGTEWIYKKELTIGFNEILAEAFGWLFSKAVDVQIPEAAVVTTGGPEERGWLSQRIPNVTHWDSSKSHFVENMAELGRMLAVDAVLFNDDRHAGNILLEALDDEEPAYRAWAIDFGKSRVGWPSDFPDLTSEIPSAGNIARGLPVGLMEPAALDCANALASLSSSLLSEFSREACGLVSEDSVTEYTEVLQTRCGNAVDLTRRSLDQIEAIT